MNPIEKALERLKGMGDGDAKDVQAGPSDQDPGGAGAGVGSGPVCLFPAQADPLGLDGEHSPVDAAEHGTRGGASVLHAAFAPEGALRPGVYFHVPEKQYRAWPAWNWSVLSHARKCMEAVKYAWDHDTEGAGSDDEEDEPKHLTEGRLFHLALFNPGQLPDEFAFKPKTYPDLAKRTGQSLTVTTGEDGKSWTVSQGRGSAKKECSAWWDGERIVGDLPDELVVVSEKAWNANATFCRAWEREQEQSGKSAVSVKQKETAEAMARRLMEFPCVERFLENAETEVSIVWIDAETGLLCKARLDAVSAWQIADAKKTRKAASWDTWAHTMRNFGYDGQAAFYRAGLNAALKADGRKVPTVPTFTFFVCEDQPPYLPAVYDLIQEPTTVSFDWYVVGNERWAGALQQVRYCLDAGHWPAYCNAKAGEPPEPSELAVPDWLRVSKIGSGLL